MNSAAKSTRWTTAILLVLMLSLISIWGLFHRQIQRGLTRRLLLNSTTPSQEFFFDSVKNAKDPVELLQRCWGTGRVAQRALVAAFLKDSAAGRAAWLTRAEPLILACTLDADASVRELGLAALDQLHSPHLFEAARAQLNDVDPLLRRTGLDYLRKCDPTRAVPLLVRELDDPDLRNVAEAEIGLMRWSGQDFGVRASLAVDSDAGTNVTVANARVIREGVERRKAWWREHQGEYVPNFTPTASGIDVFPAQSPRPSVPDFALPDLSGKRVRLSDFRGKVVLVNFWATWCTACLKELPDLIALMDETGDRVAILGVSLDGVPDEDGDTPSEENEKHQRNRSEPDVRAKVERAAKLRKITYPVLLDPKSTVGGQYNGGELPTTVIFDAEGRVRRRFIGERNLAVFEKMIAEAEQSPAINQPVDTTPKPH